MWILLLNTFLVTIRFPKSEFQDEIYGQLNISTLPLLCTFSQMQNNLKHQLWSPTEVNMLGNRESFVWDTYNTTDTKFTTTFKLSNRCSSQKLQQYGNDNFVPFHPFSRFRIFSDLPNCALLKKLHWAKVVWIDEYTRCWVNKIFHIFHLGTLLL
jgi:hypothetical protein